MNRTILLCVLVIVTAGAFLIRAEEPDLKNVSTDDLIARLGSAEFSEREQASKALRARGPSVLPALRKAVKHKDGEVRRRVEELIPILEAIAAVAPKRVTLTAEKRPLSAILKDIEKQTGYAVEEEMGNDDLRFAFEMKEVPFWEGVERIRRETGCVIITDKRAVKNIRLKRVSTPSPFVNCEGSFRLELTGVHEDRDADFRKKGREKELGQREYQLALTVSILPEPRFQLLGIDPPKVESAQDENNEKMAAVSVDKEELNDFRLTRAIRKMSDSEDGVPYETDIRLQRSTTKGKIIKEVRGSILVHVVVDRKDVVVTEKFLESEGTSFRMGNDTLKISRTSQGEKGDYFHLEIEVPKQEDFSLRWRDRIHLEDAKGHRLKSNGGGSGSTGDRHWIDFGYPKPEDPEFGPPAKVVVEDWTIMRHPIPFVFKDVPLP